MTEDIQNIAASVKQRLLNLSQQRGEDFNVIQVRYATERLLYRLSVSDHARDFLLKGAMLFVLWDNHPHRPTRDVDFLFLKPYDMRELENIFRQVATTLVPADGLVFNAKHVQATDIREANTYGGIRIKMLATMGSARIPIQIDIGLGDTVHPEPEWVDFTTLLEFPAPRIRTYPIETVVAEKLQAIVELGNRNTRLKDFFDILYLLKRFEFDGAELQQAIRMTFHRRKTPLPEERPTGLDPSFAAMAQTQWDVFLRKNGLTAEQNFVQVSDRIARFALPPCQEHPFTKKWRPDFGWV